MWDCGVYFRFLGTHRRSPNPDAKAIRVPLSRDHQLVEVALACSSSAQALTARYLAGFVAAEHFVDHGLELMPLAGAAELEPGDFYRYLFNAAVRTLERFCTISAIPRVVPVTPGSAN